VRLRGFSGQSSATAKPLQNVSAFIAKSLQKSKEFNHGLHGFHDFTDYWKSQSVLQICNILFF